MFDSNDLVRVIKKVAVDAVNASRPSDVAFGKVISTSPLKIKVDQKLILTSAQLVLSRNVTDYRLSVTVNDSTESTSGGSGESSFANHKHSIKGTKTITVNNSLEVDDIVIMIQAAGGQKYIVIDRIGKG